MKKLYLLITLLLGVVGTVAYAAGPYDFFGTFESKAGSSYDNPDDAYTRGHNSLTFCENNEVTTCMVIINKIIPATPGVIHTIDLYYTE